MKPDIIALLGQQNASAVTPQSLPLIGLWQKSTHHLMFFTLIPEQFATHYSEQGRQRYMCLGDSCPACEAGVRSTEHMYLPVWDVANRRIAVLNFHLAPNGPAQRVLVFLEAYRDQLDKIVALFDCEGQGQFHISAREVLPETDAGAVECADFCKKYESGEINPRSCVRQLSADAIRQLPGIGMRACPKVGAEVLPSVGA